MKIVVLDGYTLNPGDLSWGKLEELGETTIYDRTAPEDVEERIKGADVIFLNKVPLIKEAIENCSAKYIGVLATGYNIVDIEAAKKKGIMVSNIPTYGTSSVAQMTFAHILNIYNQVSLHSDTVKMGEWQNNKDWCYWKTPLRELMGKSMGIIGYGRIGQNVGAIAQAFGMKVLAYDQHQIEGLESDTMEYVELDCLFKESDIISLHCPLFEETRGIINKNNLDKMKHSAVLINTSRGELIVEEDLAEALNENRIFAAGVDVVSKEPILEKNPLLQCKNIYITPHISWASSESRARLLEIAIENIKGFIEGNPRNIVNK